ncbi:MAG: ATP-dependent DNA helicase [Clostridia bacterium]|nr:ATP-dependent DNA helicase [Clostridia bacterium]
MKFEQKEKILRLSAEELVLLAAAYYNDLDAALPPRLPARPADGAQSRAKCAFALSDLQGELLAEAPLRKDADGTVLTLRFLSVATDKKQKEKEKRLLRGYGYLLSYAFAAPYPPAFCFYLENESGEEETLFDLPRADALEAFFARALTALAADAEREVERVTKRLPSFLSVAFPYADVREGQRDMMGAVFAAVKQGEVLFAAAPTGTGKTMAALFPALRAVGQGHADKIFYLTPKTTSAREALRAAELLASHGMHLRCLYLAAKERLCAGRAERGDCSGCRCRHLTGDALRNAVTVLLSRALPVVGEKVLSEIAALHGVCPYRLALAYSRYADLVVGDYNYLFDPAASPEALFRKGEERIFLIDEAHNLPDRARETYSGVLCAKDLAAARALYPAEGRAAEVLALLGGALDRTVNVLLKDDLRKTEDGHAYGFAKSANFPDAFRSLLEKSVRTLLEELRDTSAEDPALKQKRAFVYFLKDFLSGLEGYDGHYVTYALREDGERRLSYFCIDPSARVCERLSLGRAAVFFSATLAPLDYYRSVLCGKKRTVSIEVPSPFERGALCVGIMDKISVRTGAREETLPEIARVIVTAMKPRRGNYMVFCPSYDYMEQLAEAFHRLTPKTPYAVQKRQMTSAERAAFLDGFKENPTGYFVGFCVSGGIFSEGVDLVGDRLIGTVVVGVGLPSVSAERELIASYYGDLYGEGAEYAYLYPALNRILQAAGRVIRTEDDRGVAVLIDDRLRDEACRRVFPTTWRGLRYVGDRPSLTALLTRFWQEVDGEK